MNVDIDKCGGYDKPRGIDYPIVGGCCYILGYLGNALALYGDVGLARYLSTLYGASLNYNSLLIHISKNRRPKRAAII